MRQSFKLRTNKSKAMIVSAVAAVLATSSIGLPVAVNAMGNSSDSHNDNATTQSAAQYYTANVKPLNRSNVSGTANFVLENRTLTATLDMQGLEPGVHPQHIHGKEQAKAECPTNADDVNHDKFISVLEGAPAYGPIKINLTSPQTAFGTPPTPALFTPFAGTPDNKNFPVAGADGKFHFVQTYNFDNSAAADGAFASIKQLDFQHYVVHGGTAPAGVDAAAFAALGSPRPAGFDPQAKIYDALLPVGCGTIEQVNAEAHGNSGNNGNNGGNNDSSNMIDIQNINDKLNQIQTQLSEDLQSAGNADNSGNFTDAVDNQINAFGDSVMSSTDNFKLNGHNEVQTDVNSNQLINRLASAKDNLTNQLTEARNMRIDQLNHDGDVAARDEFLASFDKSINTFSSSFEQIKNSL